MRNYLGTFLLELHIGGEVRILARYNYFLNALTAARNGKWIAGEVVEIVSLRDNWNDREDGQLPVFKMKIQKAGKPAREMWVDKEYKPPRPSAEKVRRLRRKWL